MGGEAVVAEAESIPNCKVPMRGERQGATISSSPLVTFRSLYSQCDPLDAVSNSLLVSEVVCLVGPNDDDSPNFLTKNTFLDNPIQGPV